MPNDINERTVTLKSGKTLSSMDAQTYGKKRPPVDFTISTDTLSPTQPFSLTPPKPSSSVDGMLGFLDAQSESLKKAGEGLTGLQGNIASILKEPGRASATDTAFREQGVSAIDSDLADIDANILAEKGALTRQLEAIQSGPGTATISQRNISAAEANRDSMRRQADMYVIRQGLQGKYTAAVATATRAINAFVEERENKLAAAQFTYQENKDLFTKAEQRNFEMRQDERRNALDVEKVRMKEISDLSIDALKGGAPADIAAMMRSAKTTEEAMGIGGQYVGALARAAEARLGSGTGTGTVNLAPEDERTLAGAGFSSSDIADLPLAIRDFGFDAVLATLTDTKKKEALQEVYGIEEKQEEPQFLSTEYFTDLFTDAQLKESANTAGFRGFWSSWGTEKKNYLDHLMKLVDQYRKAGNTDKEILKMMQ